MKEKLKKIFNNKIFMFIFGGVLFSAVSVYAVSYFPSNQVTYDNKTSGLKSSDVQGAIDELYTTCSKATSSGKYMYYAVTNYTVNNDFGYSIPYSGNLNRCDLDGSNCSLLAKFYPNQNINSIYVTSDYLYYVVTSYTANNDLGYSIPYSGNLNRCDLDGSNCSLLANVYPNQNITF